MLGKLQFGLYQLDRDALELRKQGIPVRLQEQPLRVLAALVERPGEIITREELQQRIWGKNTFVDFDHSLNKAVNRLREALDDEPGRPRYVETIPRRGYRFIAPITAPVPMEQPPALPGSVSDAEPATRARTATLLILTGGVLVVMAIIAVLWERRSETSTLRETTHITSDAFCCPTFSRDGKLLAYVSAASDGVIHIWVQQTAGGHALQVTNGSKGEIGPDFSPDGTHIVFVSGEGGLYIAPTLGGEPKRIAPIHGAGGYPFFSPDGEKILYWDQLKAMTVSLGSGEQIPLPLNRDFVVHGRPLWSPTGDAIIFYGVSGRQPHQPNGWWIAPVARGEPRSVHLAGAEQEDTDNSYSPVRAWIGSKNGGGWIIYAASEGQVWRLFRIRVSSHGDVEEKPEQLTSGTGRLGYGVSVSEDGRLVYTTYNYTDSIYEIPTGSKGEKSGPVVELPLAEGGVYRSPSLSRDGRWMVYDAIVPGKSNMIMLRDLTSGADHVIDEVGRSRSGEATISPDGSKVAFERDCKNGRVWEDGAPLPCSFVVSTVGGKPEEICEFCTPRGFSSSGSVVLVQNYNRVANLPQKITAVDLTAKAQTDFLRASKDSVSHAYLSWDDRWVAFKKTRNPDDDHPQIMIAPVRAGVASGEAEWIAITSGEHYDDKPQFSVDGNTVYFTSTRDGYLCIWAQKLDPERKRPAGDPFPVEHFHNSAQRGTGDRWDTDLSVAKDRMLINLPQVRHDIWMTRLP